MLNLFIREGLNQTIKILQQAFLTENDYSDSDMTVRLVRGVSAKIIFIYNSSDISITIPDGMWYYTDLLSEFNNRIVGTALEGVLTTTFNHTDKKFKFEVSSGILSYNPSDTGLADLLNLAIPATPNAVLESVSAVSYYTGPDEVAFIRWSEIDPEGVVPEAGSSKLFIGPFEHWNRVQYPCIIVSIGGGNSKDFNIGKQDVGYITDPDTGDPIATKFAGLWENVELSTQVMAKSADVRDLLQDYLAMMLIFSVKEEFGRVGLRISAPVTAGGRTSLQDANDPGEIIYMGNVSTNFTSEWEAIVPFRGNQAVQILPGQYFETTPAVTPVSILRVKMNLITNQNL